MVLPSSATKQQQQQMQPLIEGLGIVEASNLAGLFKATAFLLTFALVAASVLSSIHRPSYPPPSHHSAALATNAAPRLGGGTADDSRFSPPPMEPNGHPTFEALLDEYVPRPERSNYLINVGARDGGNHDPTHPLLYGGYDGIVFEGDETIKQALYDTIAGLPQYSGKDGKPIRPHVSWGFVTPDMVLDLLAEGGARKDADVLKIDIDSYDAQLVEKILRGGYAPKVVMVEFNPDIPPPISWQQLYSPHPFNFKKAALGNYGASATAWHEIMTDRYGYGLVGMEIEDTSIECTRCEHNMWYVSREALNRRGYRPRTYGEMVEMFWRTHHATRTKRHCLHARLPCMLSWSPQMLDTAADQGDGDSPERDIKMSLAMADPDVSNAVRKVQHEFVVGGLEQLHAACKCENCKEGDPCLDSWAIHTTAKS